MLQTTLETPFVPGTNLKGVGVGAGWVFLLPSLDLGRVVCIGDPDPSVVADLARYGRSVSVWCATAEQQSRMRDALAATEPTATSVQLEADSLTTPSDSVGLVFASGAQGARRFSGRPALRRELERVLAPGGCVFLDVDPGERALRDGLLGVGERYWRTPLFGGLETAVPADQSGAIAYLLARGLDRTRASVDWLRRLVRSRRRTPGSPGRSGLESLPATAQSGSLRAAARALVEALQAVERRAARRPALRRYSRLLRSTGTNGAPPAYLIEVARATGLEIGAFSWALGAGGEYGSRKILFHLIDPQSGSLRYLVKLTRDPEFNVRLEIAERALRALEKYDLGPEVAVPQPVFYGHHHQRAILAETAIAGAPFDARTERTPECPVAGRAIAALTELGARTRRTVPVADARVRLEEFADRFESLYPLSQPHSTFLRRQLNRLADETRPCPLVFQHGDAHPGNLVVSETGAIGLLDWEAADREGLPLWDLFHFGWAYCTLVDSARNAEARADCFERHFLEGSAILRRLAGAVDRYCTRLAIPRELAEPLFYSGWMHRAIREAVMLRPDQLDSGRNLGLLRRAIDERARPGLAQLFAAHATKECP